MIINEMTIMSTVPLTNRYLIVAIAITLVVVVALAITFALTNVLSPHPRVPDVKFVGFTPEGQLTIKDTQIISVTFQVRNNEGTNVENARVISTHEGDSRYFAVDKADYIISPPIGAKGGESGSQTVNIRGINLGGQPAIEDKFTISLYVGTELTDSRQFSVRLE